MDILWFSMEHRLSRVAAAPQKVLPPPWHNQSLRRRLATTTMSTTASTKTMRTRGGFKEEKTLYQGVCPSVDWSGLDVGPLIGPAFNRNYIKKPAIFSS